MKIQFKSKELIIFESALFRTTTSLIIGEQYILLIDPNWLPIELDFIAQTIETLAKDKKKYLLFTHSDYDHIIGYGQFKHYKTIASANFVENKEKDAILQEIEKFDDQYYINRAYTIEYPDINIPIAADNFRLELGSDLYSFQQAVGHNKDGIITFNEAKGILIVGDYLSNIEFPYIYHSVAKYKETLDKLADIIANKSIAILITGHGDFTTKKQEMQKRLEESRNYIVELETALTNKQKFDTKQLYNRYKSPIIMEQFHQNNIKLAKLELG